MIIIYIQFGSCTCFPFKCVFLQLYLSLGPSCCTGLSMLPAWIIFQGSTKKKKNHQDKTSALLLGDTFCRRHLRFIITTKINHSKLEHSHDIPSTQTFSGGRGMATVFLSVVILGLGRPSLDVLQCFSSSLQEYPFCCIDNSAVHEMEAWTAVVYTLVS